MWKEFFLDTNLVFDTATSKEKWEEMISSYVSFDGCTRLEAKERLLSSRETRYDRTGIKPCFGLYREHTGERTLRQFFEENGMEQ